MKPENEARAGISKRRRAVDPRIAKIDGSFITAYLFA